MTGKIESEKTIEDISKNLNDISIDKEIINKKNNTDDNVTVNTSRIVPVSKDSISLT